MPEISEPDVLDTVNSVIQKLELLDEGGYNQLEFDPMAPIGFSEEYSGAADSLA